MKSKDIVRNVVASMAEARSMEMNEMQMEFEASSQEIGALIEVRTNKYLYVCVCVCVCVYMCLCISAESQVKSSMQQEIFIFVYLHSET